MQDMQTFPQRRLQYTSAVMEPGVGKLLLTMLATVCLKGRQTSTHRLGRVTDTSLCPNPTPWFPQMQHSTLVHQHMQGQICAA
jgi:hypothetical protein